MRNAGDGWGGDGRLAGGSCDAPETVAMDDSGACPHVSVLTALSRCQPEVGNVHDNLHEVKVSGGSRY